MRRKTKIMYASPARPIKMFSTATLETLFLAWNTIFDLVQPDLVVTDHSPTALLALRGRPIRKVNLGLAFYCPPQGFPLPYWSFGGYLSSRLQVEHDERALTDTVNQLLRKYHRPTINQLSEIFTDIDETVLATFREFDHFPSRPEGTRYWGHWHSGAGIVPRWPEENAAGGRPHRIFAYLKGFPGVEEVLKQLAQSGGSTIVLSGELPEQLQRKYASKSLRFETEPMEMARVAQECDIAVLSGGHGTTASILLAGKPMVLVPVYVEQLLNAQAVARMGAGRWVSPHTPQQFGAVLSDVLMNPTYRTGAKAFAAKYTGFVPGQQLSEIVDQLESLLKS